MDLNFGDNRSFSITESLAPAPEDVTVNTAQYFFQDHQFILTKVTKALFDDFQMISLKSEAMNDCCSIVDSFNELCIDSISSLRKLSLRAEREEILNSIIQQLVYEQWGYLLLKKLSEMDRQLKELEIENRQFLLSDMLVNEVEFKKLIVLLHWCEENAFSEPQARMELSEEISYFNKYRSLRCETLHARNRGEDLCDLDLDGALHGRLHHTDEELQNRVYSVLYTCIRCGRMDEAENLMQKVGLSALIPPLKLRGMIRNHLLTSSTENDSAFYLRRSRKLFQETLDKVIAKGTSLSQLESCLWSIIAGRLEPTLSLTSRTEDRLWCYINTSVESRLDSAIRQETSSSCNNKRNYDSNDLSVDSIFDEIATENQSPYFTIYRFLVNGDWFSLISSMNMWLKENTNVLNRYPHLIRFMAHLVLIAQFSGEIIEEKFANEILETYVDILISLNLFTTVPYYASKLPPSIAERILVDFMHEINDEKIRLDVLTAADAANISTVNLCIKIFGHIASHSPSSEDVCETDDDLINAWNWLIYPGVDTYLEALLGMNEILRRFFYVGKITKAKLMVEKSKEAMNNIINWFTLNEKDQPIRSAALIALAEYPAYVCYLNALDKFNEWFKQSKKSIPVVPEKPTIEEWSVMDMQQKLTFDVIRQKALDQLKYYKETRDELFKASVKSLECVLRFPNGWLKFSSDGQVLEDRMVVQILTDIRSQYLASVVSMLISMFQEIDNSNASLQLVELLADQKYGLAEAISRDNLRIFLKQLSVMSQK